MVAVAGASSDKEKWGWKVFNEMKKHYKTYPVNPFHHHIDGNKCYPSISSLPERPDWVITVTKPEVTEKIVEECSRLGIKNIWMQPGSESRKAINYCLAHNINVIHDACIVMSGGELWKKVSQAIFLTGLKK